MQLVTDDPDAALLEQVAGPTSAVVPGLAGRVHASVRAGIGVAVIDPHVGYTAVVRACGDCSGKDRS